MKLVVCLLHGATFLSYLTSAIFVPALGLRAQRNSLSPHTRPLSTADLVRTSYRSTLPLQVQTEGDVFGIGDFTAIPK